MKVSLKELFKKYKITIGFTLIVIVLLFALFLISNKEKIDNNKYYSFKLKDIPHCYSGNQEFCWINDNQIFDDWEYRFQIKEEDKILIIRNMTEENK